MRMTIPARSARSARRAVAGVVVALAASLSACRDDRSADVPSAVVPGEAVVVQALDNTFAPTVVEVPVGTTVVWRNDGRNEHDVLSVHGPDWGVIVEDFPPGAEYAHVFTEPGSYRYVCTVHGKVRDNGDALGMVGTVVVAG